MAAGNQVRAGRAFVELGVSDRMKAGLAAAQKKLDAFGASVQRIGAGLTAVGSAALAPLAASSKVFADMGSELFDAAARTGFTVEQLSALKLAAELSGSSLEELEVGLRRLAKEGEASPEAFARIADEFAQIPDASERARRAQELFGRSGTKLLPILTSGARGLDEYTESARRLGLIMSTQDAAAADEFGDALDVVFAQLKAVTFQVGAAVANALLPFANTVQDAGARVIALVKANHEFIVTFGGVAAAAAAAGVAVVAFGTAIKNVAVVVGLLTAPLSLVGAAVTALAGAFLYSQLAGETFAEKMRSAMLTVRDAILSVQIALKRLQVGFEGTAAGGGAHGGAFRKLRQFTGDDRTKAERELDELLAERTALHQQAVADQIKAGNEAARIASQGVLDALSAQNLTIPAKNFGGIAGQGILDALATVPEAIGGAGILDALSGKGLKIPKIEIPDLGDAMEKLTAPLGIFNPRALQSLFGGGTGIQEKQLRVQTESRQLLARIADRQGNVFT